MNASSDELPQYATRHPHRVPPGDEGVVFHVFRGSGPGGQKKNKTSSAVRAVHEPTGLWAVATDHREQARNKHLALERLRFELTVRLRARVFLDRLESPEGWSAAWLELPRRDPRYLAMLGWVLDVLAAAGWVVRDAAAALGASTGRVSKLLTSSPEIGEYVNRMRQSAGLKPLRPD